MTLSDILLSGIRLYQCRQGQQNALEKSRIHFKLGHDRFVKGILEERYPQALKIRLVMDNLNTHSAASLYEAFEPEARRLARLVSPYVSSDVDGGRARLIMGKNWPG